MYTLASYDTLLSDSLMSVRIASRSPHVLLSVSAGRSVPAYQGRNLTGHCGGRQAAADTELNST